MFFINIICEDVLLEKKLYIIFYVILLSLHLSSTPSQIICLQFLGFTVVFFFMIILEKVSVFKRSVV